MTDERQVELELVVHAESSLAYMVSDDGDRRKAVWLPKSKIDFEGDPRLGKQTCFLVPEWLAAAKGLT